MFDLLKKKISSFVSAFTKKEEETPSLPAIEPAAPARIERAEVPQVPFVPTAEPKAAPEVPKTEIPAAPSKPQVAEEKQVGEITEKPAPVEAPRSLPVAPVPEARLPEKKQLPEKPFAGVFAPPKPVLDEGKKEREFAPKLGIISAIKSVFTNKVKISEAETKELFGEFEIALLESDVSPDTALALVGELKKRLVGREVEKGKVGEEVKREIGLALQSLLSQKDFDFLGKLREKKAQGTACRILFLGPNGAGKTTTIAKVAALLKAWGFSSVISASDTFRAAAIEQAVFHGEKLGIKVVRHAYGADPAAVAFDAIRHAEANKLDAVLIDTAGRQETNRNLVEEMKKISRVCNPDVKLFVGEAVSGNALVEQVKAFKQAVGVDGIILTKLDCDAKGGNSLSISRETGVPMVFLGTGQEYSDLAAFDPQFVVKKVLEA